MTAIINVSPSVSSNPMIRGASYAGYEFAPVQGYWPDDPSGAQAGQANGPNLPAMTVWNLNGLRLPLNQAAWLRQFTYDTAGILHDADPQRNYQSSIINQVNAATAAGKTVILVLHWSNPGNVTPMKLPLMADREHSPDFWTSVSNTFKSYPNVQFQLLNEPILFYGALSGGTYWQIWKSGGILAFTEATSSTGAGASNVHVMNITAQLGHFRPGSTITNGTQTANVVDHDLKNGRLYYGSSSGTFVGTSITQSVRATKPMIGRTLPCSAVGGGTASAALNANYNDSWRTSGSSGIGSISIDISTVIGSVPAILTAYRPILFAWTNPDSFNYDVTSSAQGTFIGNLPRDYTIEVNPAAGGGAAPTTGWIIVATVVGNSLIGRQHLFNAYNRNWIRMNVTACRGSAGNLDCKVNIDIWDASDTITGAYGGQGTTTTDGVLFVGDSITARSMGTLDGAGPITCASWGATVALTTGHTPPYQNGGQSGWKTTDFVADDGTGRGVSVFESYLERCPYKYVTIAVGSNDAGPNAGLTTPAVTYVANMLFMAQLCIQYGRIPIIPTICYSTATQRETNNGILNAALASALASHPEILPGPDIHAYFQANPSLISGDFLHPSAQGGVNLRTLVWGGWATSTLYAPTATMTTYDAGWQTAGMQELVTAVRATGATNFIHLSGVSWANDFTGWLANVPTDPLGLGFMGASWHPYPPIQNVNTAVVSAGGSGHVVGDVITFAQNINCYRPLQLTVSTVSAGAVTGFTYTDRGSFLQTHLPTTLTQASTTGAGTGFSVGTLTWSNVSAQGSMPSNWPTLEAIIAAGYPVTVAEIGDHSAAGLGSAPWLDDFLPWANAHAAGVYGWSWNTYGWNPGNNVLIKDVSGTPTDGFGTSFKNWALTF